MVGISKPWSEIGEFSHKRTAEAKKRRFSKRYEKWKIDSHGQYIGYLYKGQQSLNETSAPVDAANSSNCKSTSAPVDVFTYNASAYHTSAPVDVPESKQHGFISAPVEGYLFNSDSEVADEITALKREKELLSLGNAFLAAKIKALEEQNEILESRLGQVSDLRLENFQLFNHNQQVHQQLQRAEHALGVWMTHAESLCSQQVERFYSSPSEDVIQTSFDDARATAIERAVIRMQETIDQKIDNQQTDTLSQTLDGVIASVSDYQSSATLNVERLVSSLHCSVQEQVGRLQQQLDFIRERCIPSFEDEADKWYDATALQSLSIPATDVINSPESQLDEWNEATTLHTQSIPATDVITVSELRLVNILRSDGSWAKSPGQERDAICDQLHTKNVVLKRPVQREGGYDAGYDQLQNNVVGDRPVQRNHDKEDAGCDQLQNNVVNDGPVQRNGGNGSAQCHQLQYSHNTMLSRPDGSWAKSPGREFAISEGLANAIRCSGYDWLHLTCNQWDSYSLFHAPQGQALYGGNKTDKGKLSAEEMRVAQMSEAEWNEKEASDRRLLLNLFPGIDSEQVDDAPSNSQSRLSGECCPYEPAPPLTIGSRVSLKDLNTRHLNGMTGMVAGNLNQGRYPVQLEDGTTRKFQRQNLLASVMKQYTRGSQSCPLHSYDADHSGSRGDESD